MYIDVYVYSISWTPEYVNWILIKQFTVILL